MIKEVIILIGFGLVAQIITWLTPKHKQHKDSMESNFGYVICLTILLYSGYHLLLKFSWLALGICALMIWLLSQIRREDKALLHQSKKVAPKNNVPLYNKPDPWDYNPGDYVRCKVNGVSYGQRQQHINETRINDTIYLEREPDNSHDKFAIKVTWNGHHIGYIPADLAESLSEVFFDMAGITRLKAKVVMIHQSTNQVPTGLEIGFTLPSTDELIARSYYEDILNRHWPPK